MAKAPAKAAPAVKAPSKPAPPSIKAAKKSGGMIMLLLGLVGGGVVATVGGWLLGVMIAGAAIERLAPAASPSEVAANGEPAAKTGGEKAGDAGHPPEGEAAEAKTESGDGHGGG
jgi:predicted lipid-binding transport protein (Tim44 family)